MQIPEFFFWWQAVSFWLSCTAALPKLHVSMYSISSKTDLKAVFTRVPFLSQMTQARLRHREKSYLFFSFACCCSWETKMCPGRPFSGSSFWGCPVSSRGRRCVSSCQHGGRARRGLSLPMRLTREHIPHMAGARLAQLFLAFWLL